MFIVAIAGALGAALANRGVAVFHDGLRSVMPEFMHGRMRRTELASIAFGMCFGLWIGFGLPLSLVGTVFLTHVLWLGTDVIGTWFPGDPASWRSNRASVLGLAGASLAGALYGTVLVLGLDSFLGMLQSLPVKVLDSAAQFGDPVIFSFAAAPAVAVAYQHGFKRGLIAFLITLGGRLLAGALGLAQPDAWGLAAGLIVFFALALREPRDPECTVSATSSPERVRRIVNHLPAIGVLGAVYGLACHWLIMMEGPQASIALTQGDRVSAIGISLARALCFLPLRTMSALSTGVLPLDGLGFVPATGLLAPNALVAVVSGALVMTAEAASLVLAARFLDRFPGLLQAADSIRTSMTRLLELATLVGGMMAANAMAPGVGLFAVAAVYLLNETAGSPMVRAAVGPAAVIVLGIVLNALVLLGLYVPVG